MAGSVNKVITPAASFVTEFFLKSGLVAGAVALYPIIHWAAGRHKNTYLYARFSHIWVSVVGKSWQGNYFQHYKMFFFGQVLADFLTLDNAYLTFFNSFCKEYADELRKMEGKT